LLPPNENKKEHSYQRTGFILTGTGDSFSGNAMDCTYVLGNNEKQGT